MDNTENFSKKAFFDRLYQLRISYAGKRGQKNFAQAIGLSPSTYNYYEKNRLPPADVLVRIAQVTGADLNWLLTGKTDLKNPVVDENSSRFSKPGIDKKTEDSLLRNIEGLVSKEPDASAILSAFLSLIKRKDSLERSMAEQSSLANDSQAAGGSNQKQEESTLSEQTGPDADRECGWIPVLGRTAAGFIHCWKEHIPEPSQAVTELNELVESYVGQSIISYDSAQFQVEARSRPATAGLRQAQANLVQTAERQSEGVVEFLDCAVVRRLYPDCFALRIDGDSMAPRIGDGDFVLLSPSVPAGQGAVAVLQLKGQIGLTCKLIRYDGQKVHMVPFNERYQTKVADCGKLLWALAVLGTVRLRQNG